MTYFNISLGQNKFEFDGDLVIPGYLVIGEFNETFQASLSYWDRDKYLSQWKEALRRLSNGERSTALVTKMYNPNTANFIFWWVFYLIKDIVHIQNQILFLNELERPFEESNLYEFIPARETHTQDGILISEWTVNISDIKNFIETH